MIINCHSPRGDGMWENGANKGCTLESDAIANFIKYQIIYTWKVKKCHMNKVSNHKGKQHVADKPYIVGKPHMTKACFSIATYKQIIVVMNNLK